MNTTLKDPLDAGLYGGGVAQGVQGGGGLIDLQRMIRLLLNRKWRIALGGAALAVVAAAYALSLPTVYASSAKIALNTRETNLVGLDLAISGLPANPTTIDSELQILNSPELVGGVVDRLDLVSDPEFNPALRPPSALAEAIATARERLSSALFAAMPAALTGLLGGGGEDDAISADLAAALERQTVVSVVAEAITIEQLGTVSAVFRITATSQSRRKAAAIANALVDEYIERQLRAKLEASRRTSEWLRQRVSELRADVERAEATLQNHLRTMPPDVDTEIDARRDRLETLRQRVDLARAELERLRARAAEDPAPGIEERIIAKESEIALLASAADEIVADIDAQTAALVRRDQLERDVEISRQLYDAFLTRLQEAAEQDNVTTADATVIARANPAPQPAGPNRKLIVAIAGVFGAFAVAAVVVLRDLLRGTYRSLDRLEAGVGLPVLGAVPRQPRADSIARLLRRLTNPANTSLLESMRGVRTALTYQNIGRRVRSVMITSTTPDEGKTSLTLMLAYSRARAGKNVLVFDCDFRRSFALRRAAGRLDISIEQLVDDPDLLDDAVVFDNSLGYSYLSLRSEAMDIPSLFAAPAFTAFIDALCARFDEVYIDTPPVLAVTDARALAPLVDTTMYLVKWDGADAADIQLGVRHILDSGAHVSGVVATMVSQDAAIDPAMRALAYNDYAAYHRR